MIGDGVTTRPLYRALPADPGPPHTVPESGRSLVSGTVDHPAGITVPTPSRPMRRTTSPADSTAASPWCRGRAVASVPPPPVTCVDRPRVSVTDRTGERPGPSPTSWWRPATRRWGSPVTCPTPRPWPTPSRPRYDEAFRWRRPPRPTRRMELHSLPTWKPRTSPWPRGSGSWPPTPPVPSAGPGRAAADARLGEAAPSCSIPLRLGVHRPAPPGSPTASPRRPSSSSPATSPPCYGGEGIRCNAIAPGFILTDTAARASPKRDGPAWRSRTRSAGQGTPEDVALVAAPAPPGPSAGFVNGQVLRVDGGLTVAPRLAGTG